MHNKLPDKSEEKIIIADSRETVFDEIFGSSSESNNTKLIDALSLYNLKEDSSPKLLDPFFQKVGLTTVVGSSDTGKSTLFSKRANGC